MSKAKGKVVDTWTYHDSTTGFKLNVPVRMYRETDGYNQTTQGTQFQINIPEYEISDVDTDIEKLRSRVFAEIARRVTIRWERFLLVNFHGYFGNGDDDPERFLVKPEKSWIATEEPDPPDLQSSSLGMSVESIEIGTRHDGSTAFRGKRRGRRAVEGLPETGTSNEASIGKKSKQETAVHALVPDTPSNRAAIAAIAVKMRDLRDVMIRFLHPDQIESTILKITHGGNALPAPWPAKGDDDAANA